MGGVRCSHDGNRGAVIDDKGVGGSVGSNNASGQVGSTGDHDVTILVVRVAATSMDVHVACDSSITLEGTGDVHG